MRIVAIVLFLIPATLWSQVILDGRVVNHQGAPVVLEVFDSVSNSVALTNDDGRFQFSLATGFHRLTVFGMDYQQQQIWLNLASDTLIHIVVHPLSVTLSTVEILARKDELFNLRQLRDVEGTAIYAGKKTEVILLDRVTGNLASNNARQIYAQIAGLNIYEGSDGGLQLGIGGRGLDPNRTSNFNTRQNGYDISADVLGYPENYYTPPVESLSEIQIIRGASSLQYGTQFGGLINFRIKQIDRGDRWNIRSRQTFGSFGLFSSFNSLGYRSGNTSVDTYLNYKKGNGYRPNSEFDAINGFVRIEHKLGTNTSLRGELTYFSYLARQAGGLTDDQFVENSRQSTRDRNWFDVDWKLFNLRLEHAITPKQDLSLSIFGLRASRRSLGFRGDPALLNSSPILALDEQRADGSYVNPRDLINGMFRNFGLEGRYLKRYRLHGRKAVFLLGAKYYHANNTSAQGPGSAESDANFEFRSREFSNYPSQSDFNFPNRNFALFGENIFYINDRISITPGFRFEYIRTGSSGTYRKLIFDNAGNAISNTLLNEDKNLDRNLFLLGVGFSYKRSKALNLYANFSQNYRSVTFSDIRVVSPSFIIDPDIGDERGYTLDVGVRGSWHSAFSYELGFYGLSYQDRIGIILDDRANRVRKNIGQAWIFGLESLLDFNIIRNRSDQSKWRANIFLNTALTTSEYIQSEEQNVVGNEVEFIPGVNLKTGIRLGYANFLVAIQYGYVSNQFTDAQNSAIAQIGDIRAGIVGEIPAYAVSDIAMSYDYKSFRFEAGINNLFDASYFTRRATGYPGPGIIPSDGRSVYLTVEYSMTKRPTINPR